jgi:hypothetical protein
MLRLQTALYEYLNNEDTVLSCPQSALSTKHYVLVGYNSETDQYAGSEFHQKTD